VHRLGSRVPSNTKEKKAHEILTETIKDIPDHRIISPTAQIWTEAGILAGIRARTGGFQQTQSQDALNDALIFLQAREVGAAVITANVADFDILQQIVPNGRMIFYRAAV
jgi:predicted nucleic acid-binding protein